MTSIFIVEDEFELQTLYEVMFKAAGYDSLGACIFAGFGFADAPDTIAGMVNARYGTNFGEDILKQLGRDTIRFEVEFNRRAGFTKADDRAPEWMRHEPLPPHNTVFDVPEDELDGIFDFD